MKDSQRHEALKQIDEMTKQIRERHHEENRQKIDKLYEEFHELRLLLVLVGSFRSGLPQSQRRNG